MWPLELLDIVSILSKNLLNVKLKWILLFTSTSILLLHNNNNNEISKAWSANPERYKNTISEFLR